MLDLAKTVSYDVRMETTYDIDEFYDTEYDYEDFDPSYEDYEPSPYDGTYSEE